MNLENIEGYRTMQSDRENVDKFAPRISSIEELEGIVTPTCLLIRYDFEDGVKRVGILKSPGDVIDIFKYNELVTNLRE